MTETLKFFGWTLVVWLFVTAPLIGWGEPWWSQLYEAFLTGWMLGFVTYVEQYLERVWHD